MRMKRTLLIVGLLAIPVPAHANIGVPIAPLVGVQIIYYLPGLILIESLVICLALGLSWKGSLVCSAKWNAITTLVGFPALLLLIFGLLFLSMFTGIDVNRGVGILTHLYWSGPAIRAPEQPHSWYTFLRYATLLWTVVAFALSVEIEERLARHSSDLRGIDPKQIHWAILAANVVSYIPLWMFTFIQKWTWI